MSQRVNAYAIAPEAFTAKAVLETYIKESGFDPILVHLVKMRASQINGCANCIHMHRLEALKDGDTEKRLLLLSAFAESNLFTPREKAALRWTESLTHLPDTHAPDADYEALKAHFSDKEIIDLTFLIAQINGWNRISVGLRTVHPQDKAA